MVGGLRNGVFARRFEAANVAPTGGLFTGIQTFTVTTATTSHTITIDGGLAGIDAANLTSQLNQQLRTKSRFGGGLAGR